MLRFVGLLFTLQFVFSSTNFLSMEGVERYLNASVSELYHIDINKDGDKTIEQWPACSRHAEVESESSEIPIISDLNSIVQIDVKSAETEFFDHSSNISNYLADIFIPPECFFIS